VSFARGRGRIAGFLPPATDMALVDQFVLEVAVDLDFAVPVAASPCTGGGAVATAADPAEGPALAGAISPVVWIVLHLASGDYAYAYEVLNDPASYHGGQKRARILSMGEIARAASDDFGGPIASRLEVTFLDQDGTFRARETAETLRYRTAEIFLADDATRLALGTARRIGFYVIDDYEPTAALAFTIRLVDILGSEISSYRAQKTTPDWTFTRDIQGFEQLPVKDIGKVVPIYYGSVSDESLPDSATPPPTITSAAPRGGFLEAGLYQMIGFGDIAPAASVAIPTSVALVATGVGTVSVDVPDGKYGVIAQAQDASGVWTDPAPFFLDQDGGGSRGTFQPGVPTAIPSGSQKLVASCAAVASAVRYRFTLYYYYFGARSIQQIESATPSVDFTTSPSWTVEATSANVTPGATPMGLVRRRYYVVAARMADGLTGVSGQGAFIWRGPLRPAYPEVVPVVGALEYWWYASDAGPGEPGYGFTRLWKTTTPFLHDNFDDVGATAVLGLNGSANDQGAIGFTFTGTELIGGILYDRWIAAGGVVTFKALFGSDGGATPIRVKIPAAQYGTTVLCPGKTGWPFAEDYREFGEAWYSTVYVLTGSPIALAARDATVPIGANICGLRANVTTGNTIDNLVDQVVHYLNNFLLPKTTWRKGAAWFPILTENGVPRIRTSSAATVKAKWATLVTGGIIGAWGIGWDGKATSVDAFMRMAARNLGIKWFSNHHGQIGMFMIDPTAASAASFSDQSDVLLTPAPTFQPMSGSFANVGLYRYKRQYLAPVTRPTPSSGALLPPTNADTTDWLSGTIRYPYAASITAHQGVEKERDYDFEMHRDGAAPSVLVSRDLNLCGFPRKRYAWTSKLKAYDRTHGDLVSFTHFAGATSGGDINRKIVIDDIAMNPDFRAGAAAFNVTLEGIDVTGLVL
jgi:hypothetical protein